MVKEKDTRDDFVEREKLNYKVINSIGEEKKRIQ
jgi:hypothetical protein